METHYAGCVIFKRVYEHGSDACFDDGYSGILSIKGKKLKFENQEDALSFLLEYAKKKGYDLYKTHQLDTCLYADVQTLDPEIDRIHITYWIEDLYEII